MSTSTVEIKGTEPRPGLQLREEKKTKRSPLEKALDRVTSAAHAEAKRMKQPGLKKPEIGLKNNGTVTSRFWHVPFDKETDAGIVLGRRYVFNLVVFGKESDGGQVVSIDFDDAEMARSYAAKILTAVDKEISRFKHGGRAFDTLKGIKQKLELYVAPFRDDISYYAGDATAQHNV